MSTALASSIACIQRLLDWSCCWTSCWRTFSTARASTVGCANSVVSCSRRVREVWRCAFMSVVADFMISWMRVRWSGLALTPSSMRSSMRPSPCPPWANARPAGAGAGVVLWACATATNVPLTASNSVATSMYYRVSGKGAFTRPGEGQRARSKAALRALAARDPPPGLLGYRGETPVGWVSLGPRADYAKLAKSPVMHTRRLERTVRRPSQGSTTECPDETDRSRFLTKVNQSGKP